MSDHRKQPVYTQAQFDAEVLKVVHRISDEIHIDTSIDQSCISLFRVNQVINSIKAEYISSAEGEV